MRAEMQRASAARKRHCLLLLTLACAVLCGGAMQQSLRAVEPHKGKTAALSHDWPVYGGQKANDHYSPLAQINRSNVGRLKVAWTYDTGEKGVGLQTSPLIVGRTLYAYTPSQKVIALNAATGKLLWSFDSGLKSTQPVRGLTWWSNDSERRLFAGIAYFLY